MTSEANFPIRRRAAAVALVALFGPVACGGGVAQSESPPPAAPRGGPDRHLASVSAAS